MGLISPLASSADMRDKRFKIAILSLDALIIVAVIAVLYLH